jgi:hypothetical protein
MSNGTVGAREPLYFDELAPGRRFTTQNYALEEAEIKTFAAQYGPQSFHVGAAAASHSVFGGLGGEISWPRATRAGDVLPWRVKSCPQHRRDGNIAEWSRCAPEPAPNAAKPCRSLPPSCWYRVVR